MVNPQTLKGNWNEIQGRLQQRWGELTGDELRQFQGGTQELVGMIQRKTGEARETIERYLDEISESSGGEQVQKYARQATAAVQRAGDQIADQAQQGYAQAERMIREHPGQSVSVAFGAGMLAGVVVGLMLRMGR